MSVRFRFDWVDAPPAPDERARATMAALSIETGNAIITDVLDRPRRIRDHVVVPLCCVAEWLICNWWHIFHEVEDTREQKPDFEARHDLAFAGDGFVLPRLSMAPTPERMRLRWSRYKPPHAPIEFVAEGEVDVARADLEEQCRDLIEAALERLRSRGIGLGAFADEWTALNALDRDEREFSRSAALLGVDPFAVPDSLAGAIAGLWEGAAPSLRDDALAAASADSVPQMSAWLTSSLADLDRAESGGDWPALRQALPPPTDAAAPWERGYDLARAARVRTGAGTGRFDFPPTGPLSLHWRKTQPPSARIEGLTAADAPSCMTAPRSETGKRFLMARALGDYLDRSEPGPALLSSLATERQARSRAFAAEFLAPSESLRRRLNGGPVEPETVDELGLEFGVSSMVIRHQIDNHGLATIAGW